MIKKLNLLLTFILISVTSNIYAQSNLIDGVIWVVGDEPILKSDVESQRLMMLMGKTKITGDPYCFIPEQIAISKLFVDQARIDSIVIDPMTVTRAVADQENRYIVNLGSREKVEEYMGMSITRLREFWKEQYRDESMIERVKNKIVSSAERLTPSEVRRYYEQLPKDSLPNIPTTYELQIITCEPVIPLAEKDKVKNRLRSYIDRVNAGESFASIAIFESEDNMTANKGGDLGPMSRASLATEFANVAFALNDPKKVSSIVETEYGFHIIQLIERNGDVIRARHILQRAKVPVEEMTKAINVMDTLAMRLRAESYTFENAMRDYHLQEDVVIDAMDNATKNKLFQFEDAARQFSADKDSRNNGGLMTNTGKYTTQSTSYLNTPRFTQEELPVEIARVVDTLRVGNISAPFVMKETNQKNIVAIVKLKKKTESHIANIKDDFEVMREIVIEQKREDAIEKWIRKKIKNTYVRIDDNWVNCDFKYPEWLEIKAVTK